MKIAVEGCCHGELDTIYDTLAVLEKKNNIKVDLLLICGDFQSVRNKADMECMAVPPKHRKMNTFYKYYSGEKTAPVLTIFIGGNHEASNYLQELPYGGWVAPKIYYLGYAGVVQYRGVRIGGLSGIYKGKDYLRGHFEHPPYNEDSKRSAYHIRNLEVFRLKQLKSHVDVFMSHDWPRGIHNYGNAHALIRKKKYFKEEMEKGILGNPVAADLLYLLQPTYWFSAHLHVKFPALVQHSAEEDSKLTKFLALDKCLPRRQFLQVLDVSHDPNKAPVLELDPEWLVILKLTNHMLDLTRNYNYIGSNAGERTDFTPTEDEIKQVTGEFGGDFSIPDNFERTVPVFDPNLSKKENKMDPAKTEVNPQTTLICSMLDLTDPNAVFLGKDSTYKLPDDDDADTQELEDEDDMKNDDIDDEFEDDSEPSFIMSDSDRSHSFLSTGNDSFLSTGNESFQSIGNESFASVSNVDESSVNDNENGGDKKKIKEAVKLNSEFKLNSSVHKLSKEGRRISLSEKLAKCDEGNKSNSASSTTSDEDDLEFQAIMAAQKAKNSTSKSDDDLEVSVSKNSVGSDSSLDCKKLEISDEDTELQEMMRAQRESKGIMELSMESEEIEFKQIIKAQKEDSRSEIGNLREIQKDFMHIRPSNQSSPFVSNDDRAEQSMAIKDAKDLSPSLLGMRRGDSEQTTGSPAMKKFRRRNQDMYSDNSTGEED